MIRALGLLHFVSVEGFLHSGQFTSVGLALKPFHAGQSSTSSRSLISSRVLNMVVL